MKNKKGISLIVLIITIVVVIILTTAIILSLSNSNPIDSSRVAKAANNYDNMRTDLQLYVNNVKAQTKAYFTTEEILTGTGNVREGVDFSDNDKVGKNADGTSNASGYKIVGDMITVALNDRSVKVYDIDKEKYENLVSKIPDPPSASAKWYIDVDLNVYLVYDQIDDIPKWFRGKAEDAALTDDSALMKFLAVKSFGNIPDNGLVEANCVAVHPDKYYGATVTNYSANGISSWQVFHSAGKNIYLIASDFLSSAKVPKTKGGTSLDYGTTGSYPNGVSLKKAATDSSYRAASGAILTGNPARQWLSYLDGEKAKPSTLNNNMRSVAYLLDTSVWNVYKDDTYAAWAIGAPTLEMFADSYNNYPTHSLEKIDTIATHTDGYEVKWSTASSYSNYISGLGTSELSNLWIKGASGGSAYGYYLASPSHNSGDYLMCAKYSGGLTYTNYEDSDCGLRPVVCLNPGVKVKIEANGQITLQ